MANGRKIAHHVGIIAGIAVILVIIAVLAKFPNINFKRKLSSHSEIPLPATSSMAVPVGEYHGPDLAIQASSPPDAVTGDEDLTSAPNSFDVTGSRIVVNDPAHRRVVIYNQNGQFISDAHPGFSPTRVHVLDDTLLIQLYSSPSDVDSICRLSDSKVTCESLRSRDLDDDKRAQLRLERDRVLGKGSVDISSLPKESNLVSRTSLGADKKGDVFVLLELCDPGPQIRCTTTIRRYSPSGAVVWSLNQIPPQTFVTMEDEFRISAGNLYQLIVTSEKVSIKRWRTDVEQN